MSFLLRHISFHGVTLCDIYFICYCVFVFFSLELRFVYKPLYLTRLLCQIVRTVSSYTILIINCYARVTHHFLYTLAYLVRVTRVTRLHTIIKYYYFYICVTVYV